MDRGGQRDAEKELIRSRVRLDELARDLAGCQLQERGPDDLWACCPFHTEDTPSFHLRPRMGMFKCFGCGESGDVFSFVQKILGFGFRESLEFLAERVGVTLGSLSPEDRRRQQEARRVREVLETAGKLFASALGGSTNATGLRYMRQRGFSDELLQRFDVGWVPDDFSSRLSRAGLAERDLRSAGFTRAFGNRVSFGIRDGHGGLVGFGARTLDPDGGPKYVNTRESVAFNKRKLLYGLDKASRAIMRSRRAVVMEGYTDVMMAHQKGLEEAVAAMGTSLTEDHLRSLRARATNLVFVFDGDAAGLGAAERSVRLALAEGLEVRVLTLPDGADPGDWFLDHDAEDFDRLLGQHGQSTVRFLCEQALARLDPSQPGGREDVAREVLEAARTITDPVRQEGLVAEVALSCGLDRNVLRRAAGRTAVAPAAAGPARPRRGLTAMERCQLYAVGGLAVEARAADELADLEGEGLLTHAGALRLLALGRELGPAPVEASDWLTLAAEQAPELAPVLERLLLPPPDAVDPSYAEAVAHLRHHHDQERERSARRTVLSRPDLASDPAALAALDASLRATRGSNESHSSESQAAMKGSIEPGAGELEAS